MHPINTHLLLKYRLMNQSLLQDQDTHTHTAYKYRQIVKDNTLRYMV